MLTECQSLKGQVFFPILKRKTEERKSLYKICQKEERKEEKRTKSESSSHKVIHTTTKGKRRKAKVERKSEAGRGEITTLITRRLTQRDPIGGFVLT